MPVQLFHGLDPEGLGRWPENGALSVAHSSWGVLGQETPHCKTPWSPYVACAARNGDLGTLIWKMGCCPQWTRDQAHMNGPEVGQLPGSGWDYHSSQDLAQASHPAVHLLPGVSGALSPGQALPGEPCLGGRQELPQG